MTHSIEATLYAPDLNACYKELKRVAKPGGIVRIYGWQMTDRFDPDNPRHVELRHLIEYGDDITTFLAHLEPLEAMRKAGLEIDHHENLVERKDRVPWWHGVDGDITKTTTWGDWWKAFWLKEWAWKLMDKRTSVSENLIWRLPKGTCDSMWMESRAVFGMRDAAKVRQQKKLRRLLIANDAYF